MMIVVFLRARDIAQFGVNADFPGSSLGTQKLGVCDDLEVPYLQVT